VIKLRLEIYIGFHIMYPLFLCHRFSKTLKYQISWRFVLW